MGQVRRFSLRTRNVKLQERLLREPLEHVQAKGFSIESLERSKLGLVERLLGRKPGRG